MQDLRDKTALITGGASGIGLALAHALAREGARVAIADIEPARLATAESELRSAGATVTSVVLDVASLQGWQTALPQVEQSLGPVQILCNNAGVGSGANDVAELPPEHWSWAVGVNLNGVFYGAHVCVARMRALRLPGHVVNTASIMGLMPIARQPAYIATKYAVVGLSENMRIDLAPHGIGVSVLCPGLVETPLRANSLALRPGGGDTGFGFASQDGKLTTRPVGMPAGPIADMVVQGIRDNRLYLLPHPEYQTLVSQRAAALRSAFAQGAAPGYSEDPMYLGADCNALFPPRS